ncbi:MAG: Cps2K [Clostridium butyricum DORA_1]|nr:MAG: Cps2K [Clostridium butyricum DORA_1]
MKLTLILPIYNVEKYLTVCLDSIVKQKQFENCEILLINDGSTDGSGDLCNIYAKKYSNIKAFHKVNGGLSDARNYGLKRANGEYVLFIDSDDYICDGAIEKIIDETLNYKVDILMCDASVVNEDGGLVTESKFNYVHKGLLEGKVYSGQQALKEQLLNGTMQTTVWLGIYRRKFLVENKLWFKQDLLHEDELWTPQVFILAKYTKYISEKFYTYRIRNNSIMRNKTHDNSKNIISLIYIYDYLNKEYSKINDIDLQKLIRDDWSRRYLHIAKLWEINKYPQFCNQIDKKAIFKNSKKLKNKIRAIIFRINISFYCKLSQLIKN